jgi:hypothetical protein
MSQIKVSPPELQSFLDWLHLISDGFPQIKILQAFPFKIEVLKVAYKPDAIKPEYLVEMEMNQRALVLNLTPASAGATLAENLFKLHKPKGDTFEFTANNQIKIFLDRCHDLFPMIEIQGIAVSSAGIEAKFQMI